MAATIQTNFRMRHTFGKIEHIIEIPNLIDIQKRSYDKFLQTDVSRDDRENIGLQGVFNSVFPIRDFNGTSEFVFSGYTLERPKYDVDECRQRGMTYAAPIKVTIQLMIYDANGESTERSRPRHQGAGGLLRRDPADDRERHVHHQRHRARGRQPAPPKPGRLLRPRQGQDPLVRQAAVPGAHHPVPRLVARLRVRPEGHPLRPHRPSPQDARHRASPRARATPPRSCSTTSTTPRRSNPVEGRSTPSRSSTTCSPVSARRATSAARATRSSYARTASSPGRDPQAQESRPRPSADRRGRAGRQGCGRGRDRRRDRRGSARSATRRSPRQTLERSASTASSEFKVLFIDNLNVGSYLRDTLLADKVQTAGRGDPGDLPTPAPGRSTHARHGRNLFHNLFFNAERYDLSKVGRLKLNYKFYKDVEVEERPVSTTPFSRTPTSSRR